MVQCTLLVGLRSRDANKPHSVHINVYRFKSEEKQMSNPNKRLVSRHGEGRCTTKVYYNREYGEYSVHLFIDGKDRGEESVSYHSDKEDAQATASMVVEWLSSNAA